MRIRAICAALLATCSVLAGPPVAARADAGVDARIEGRLLAPDWDPNPAYFQFESVTNSYFTFEPGLRSELPEPWEIRSTTDGRVVERARNDFDVPHDNPRLAGDQVVTRTSVPGGTRIDFRGLDGVASAEPVTVPSTDTELVVHRLGVLVERAVGNHSELRLIRSSGEASAISGAPFTWTPKVFDIDGDVLLVRDESHLYTVDLATATAEPVAEVPTLDWAALTPHRVVWRTGWSGPANNPTQHLAWRQRDGSADGIVDAPYIADLLTIGDDAAALRIPDQGSYLRPDLVRIPLDGSAIGVPLVTGVAAARSLDDGRVLYAEDFDVSVITAGGVSTKLADIARPVRGTGPLALSGARVVSGSYSGGMRETTLTATVWQQIAEVPIGTGVGYRFQLGGDVLYTEEDATLRWPGGQRVLPANTAGWLGRGGKLIAVLTSDHWDTYWIQDAKTGQQLATRPNVGAIAMDGTWVWVGPDATTGRMSGTDLATGQTKVVETAARCSGYLNVAGRWALDQCDKDNVWAIDLDGVLPSYRVPIENWTRLAVLGDGFVVHIRYTPGSDGVSTPELVVTDLNSASHTQVVVGPAQGHVDPPGSSFASDEAGAPRLVYADPEHRARVLDIDWLAPPPPPDTAAPVLTSASAGPRTNPTRTVSFAWSFTDIPKAGESVSGLGSYDVRYRQRSSATAPYGDWRQPTAWQMTTASKVSLTAAPGVDTCFQVRARDRSGNLGTYSSDRCSAVDATPPALITATAGDRVRTSTAPVRFLWGFRDNGTLASYDVGYRLATAGHGFGQWTYPIGWRGLKTTAVSLSVAAGTEACFEVRARDAVGNLSSFSASRCTTVPQDDRALSASGSVTRTAFATAYRGTLTRLNAKGAAVAKSGESGHRIALLALSGPRQGTVDVYLAGYRVGRVSLAASTWSRRVYYLPMTGPLSGSVRVVSVSTLPSSIDGIALLRF